MADNVEKSEFILSTGEYGFYLDRSKGNVLVMVGPYQKSLTTSTESPMRYDPTTDRLIPCSVNEAHLRFPSARQGQYIILENPATDGKNPAKNTASPATDLQMGCKVNLAGPIEFPLWPMQRAVVLDGHQLRTDQYLIVQVYDENEAKKNKGNGFTLQVKKSKSPLGQGGSEKQVTEIKPAEFPTTLGHRFLVKGTMVAFYIPPTGYEVVAHTTNNGRKEYVRTAISLECLEYCILLDEDGNRRIEKGPQVVFPDPTETFVTDDKGSAKFRAIEIDEIKGLYVKVIEDYTEGEGSEQKEFKRGQELFITGADQRIYFPRTEHAIVSYNGVVMHYGIAIPKGEGRYILMRKTGEVILVPGPKTYLPNPIEEVVVRRVLTQNEAELLYPSNQIVARVNAKLREEAVSGSGPLRASLMTGSNNEQMMRSVSATLGGGAVGFDRGSSYTPPRTITLDSKYDGAVRIDVWPGFAVMIIDGKGARRVVKGPSTTLLSYDETPHRFTLSTGTPKSNERMIEGVYLQTEANSVSDYVEIETRDSCNVGIRLTYKVNFEGSDQGKWFSVADYVGLLTTSLRSILRRTAKQHDVLEFLQNVTDIVRDELLGKSEKENERRGKSFTENGMRVYDIDILEVNVKNPDIEQLIGNERLSIFRHNLGLANIFRQKETFEANNALGELKVTLARKLDGANAEAEKAKEESAGELSGIQAKLRQAIELAEIESRKRLSEIKLQISNAESEHSNTVRTLEIDAEKRRKEIEIESQEKLLKALGECKLPEALANIGNGQLLIEMSKNLSVQTMLGGRNLVEVLTSILGGLPIAGHLSKLTSKP